ncbi:MAG: UvrB/UvrC motif-containing protein, partial [Firmicutes bacterium]|nr:UvrB/UvrC motif-containing protein [Bacillota bacterium]
LREGLDLPEVSLVAILDADKEGFLRTETSLIQTVGRASRNADGRVIMYADSVSKAMRAAIDETDRRRAIQQEYNREHGITPETIKKAVRDVIEVTTKVEADVDEYEGRNLLELTKKELSDYAARLEKEMRQAAKDLLFERAAVLRDRLLEVRAKL